MHDRRDGRTTPDLIVQRNATVIGVLTVNDGVNAAVVDTATVTIGNLPPSAGAC